AAPLLNLWARTLTACFNSPFPRILIPSLSFLTIPFSRSVSGATLAPGSHCERVSRLTMVYSLRKTLLNPRFGKRRYKGICPPSKPGRIDDPDRDFCPL